MKKTIFSLIALVLLFCAAGAVEASDSFPAFTSRNIEGGEITSGIFADKKLTMINFWGTYCPPCIAEMPDLGKLGRSMPEGTQLAGIVIDATDPKTLDLARKILEKSDADFLQILPVMKMNPYFETLVGVPTTIFVDSEGKVVGEPLIGARSEAEYRKEIDKALKLLP